MFSSTYLCICIYCMLQLGFLILAEKRRRDIRIIKNRYFLWMLIITLFSFTADIMSSFKTEVDWLFPLVAAGNYAEIILNTALLPIYFCYVCDQVFKPDAVLKSRIRNTLVVMAACCSLLIISTAFTGWIFYFDEAKVYHRGPLFILPMFILFVMMLIIEVFLISQKKKIEPRYFKSLVLFIIAPLFGWILQLLVYGLPFSLLGITFASLVFHTNIQNRDMDKDYLTDVFNRQALDNYLQRKIDASTKNKTFSTVLLDIDDFKSINDRFGHYEGDAALVNTVRILRDSLEFTDFIARYGGDEFCIILETDDFKAVQNVIIQINNNLLHFNQQAIKPYQLSFSIGYDVYHHSMGNHAEVFMRLIDQKMYDQKNFKKNIS